MLLLSAQNTEFAAGYQNIHVAFVVPAQRVA